jgi:hypothetical protein
VISTTSFGVVDSSSVVEEIGVGVDEISVDEMSVGEMSVDGNTGMFA